MKSRVRVLLIIAAIVLIGIAFVLYAIYGGPRFLDILYSKKSIYIAMGICLISAIGSLALSFSVKPPSISNLTPGLRRKAEEKAKGEDGE